MDSMEVNKAVAAVLVAGIAFFVTGLLGDNFIFDTPPAKPPIDIPIPKTTPGGGEQGPAALPPIAPLLASADVQKGKQFVDQVCAACHSFNKGGKPIVGPNLYGIVGSPHDHEAGFDYSSALQKYKGQPWTYEALNKWLDDPQTYAPGTRMTFTGIKNNQTRADVIDYLHTLSGNPEPLPKVQPNPAGQHAPAPGTAAPAGNHSAMATASGPNSAPASSPNVIGRPNNAYNPNAQEANAGTSAGGTQAPASSNTPSGPAPIDPYLAKANIKEGDTIAHQICAACHTLNKGGPTVVGPNLYGIVGNVHDHEPGFHYSPALEKFKGQPWTFAQLNKWLNDPQTYAPGTLMAYPGVKDEQQRADVIAYLNSNSDHALPLPGKTAAAAKP
jgi:cytochrome c